MKHLMAKESASTISVILFLLAWLGFIGLVIYPKELNLQSFITGRRGPASSEFIGKTIAVKPPDFRLLIGILTRVDFYERRHHLRLVYGLQSVTTNAQIDIRFVLCTLTNEEEYVYVAMEIMRYNDIIILNCSENMNGGKTYTYLSSLPNIFDGSGDGGGPPYDYVMKTDDDTYLRLQKLAEALTAAPRKDAYLGAQHPCDPKDEFHFMAGMGYLLTWDLVEWIATSGIAKNLRAGPEDIMTGVWLRDGGRGKNRIDLKPAMYDYMEGPPRLCFRHEFLPETISVHKLKNKRRWARTLKYFNVTERLKPSKLYHVP